MADFLKVSFWAFVLAIAVGGGCTCVSETRGLAGLACSVEEHCVAGYTCDKSTNTCVKAEDCLDGDEDGYCAPTDCDDSRASCNTDCTDADGDGTPACVGDCDDTPETGSTCSTGCETGA